MSEIVPPLVSVIILCRNEEEWIGPCLESIMANDYPQERLELLVMDGMSDDRTRDVIEKYLVAHPCIRMLDNPRQTTPAAMNLGIENARGEIVVRIDAHADYPRNYISSLVRLLEESGADNVGGVSITRPGRPTAMAKAIALGVSHPLGVGDAYFRIGSSKDRWVDTVPFGCYRREVFERIGLFDEELVRDQDDELNLRLIKRGGRIRLSPAIVCNYYARDSLGKLWRQYYQYGYFKPLVVRKMGGVMTMRQVLPPLFVLVLTATALAAPWSWFGLVAFAAVTGSYLLAIAAVAARAARRHGFAAALLFGVFPVLHFSYGSGYLRGIVEFLVLRRKLKADAKTVPLTR